MEEIHIFFRVVDETESIGDYAQRLVMLTHVMNEKNLTFSQAAIKDLKLLYQELIDFLTLAKSCFMTPDTAIAAQCNEKKISTKNLIKEANEANTANAPVNHTVPGSGKPDLQIASVSASQSSTYV